MQLGQEIAENKFKILPFLEIKISRVGRYMKTPFLINT